MNREPAPDRPFLLDASAGVVDRASPILPADLHAILDSGAACAALAALPPDPDPLPRALLASSCDLLQGRLDDAAALARDVIRVLERDAADPAVAEAAVHHLSRVAAVTGDPVLIAECRRVAAHLAVGASPPWAVAGPAPTPPGASPDPAIPSYRRGAELARHAALLVARGDPGPALAAADEAVDHLARTGSPRELALAHLTAADALALLERRDLAAERCRTADRAGGRDRVVLRALAEHVAWFGDPAEAGRRLTEVGATEPPHDPTSDPDLVDAGLDPAAILRSTARAAMRAVAVDAPQAPGLIRSLLVLADRLDADLWVAVARLLEDDAGDGAGGGDAIARVAERIAPLAVGPVLGMVAPVLARRLDRLDAPSASLVAAAAAAHPERWRRSLRSAASAGAGGTAGGPRLAAARLLAIVGERSDVALLEEVGRLGGASAEDRRLGRALVRRVAPVLEVADLGRISVSVGGVPLGPIGRRKVLALLCLLVTRPDLAATREQVLDALWPDGDPETGANALNQTIYFMRRTIEPGYRERTSPGYLHHDSEVVWLDERLVSAASRRCRELIVRARGAGTAGDAAAAERAVDELATAYVARFALDFSYDPWAEPYREALHASYLATLEAAIARTIEAGDLERGIRLAERTLAIDPAAEGIELALLRLYRRAGAHAAAAERYARYASVLRDELGVEPPPLESI